MNQHIAIYPDEVNKKWDDVEMNPVFDDGKGIVDVCEEGQETYWSVYLHLADEPGMVCIADMPNKELAEKMVSLIEKIVATKV